MRRNKKDNAWTIEKDGQLVFNTLDKVTKEHFMSGTKWEHPVVALMILVCCCALDFGMFYQLFGSFLYDRVWFQWISIITV